MSEVNGAVRIALVTGANLGPDQAAWLKWREDEKR